MALAAVITLIVLIAIFPVLVFSRHPPDIVLWSGLLVLLLVPVADTGDWQIGIIGADAIVAGFSNAGVITIAALFIVAAGLRDTGCLEYVSYYLLGRPASVGAAQHRILWPTALLSAFMNNTPVVAMLLPAVSDWARRLRLSPARLLMPLSYAAILGGACTLIGTSSNLIIHGWLISELDHPGLGIFEIGQVGVPVALAGMIYIFVANRWLLRDRLPAIAPSDDTRQYTVEMELEPGSRLVGKTVREAGLRGLPGLFLIEIDRDDDILSAVSGDIVLQAGDRLVFAGVVESVVDLQKIPGLRLVTDQVFKLDEPRPHRHLVEAVVSNSCPLVGKTVREGRFRTQYNAAIIAVARHGERIRDKIGNIVLQPGDVLLLEARSNFLEQQKNRNDFYLVSKVDNAFYFDSRRSGIAVAILLAMVVLVALGAISMLKGALLAAGFMILTGSCGIDSARRSIDLQTILVLVAALGLGKAMEISGLAETLGTALLAVTGSSPYLSLTSVFAITMLLGNMITAKAGAVLMLPLALAVAESSGTSIMPFIMAVLIASATALATPIGYPTNLMVYGAGGYHFSDYLRFGIPLSLLIGVLSIVLIPVFWPF